MAEGAGTRTGGGRGGAPPPSPSSPPSPLPSSPPAPFDPWPAAVFVCLAVLAVLFLAPTLGVVLSALKSTREIALGELWALPGGLYLDNFREVLDHPSVKTYFVNTFLVTVPATAGSIGLGVHPGNRHIQRRNQRHAPLAAQDRNPPAATSRREMLAL